MIRRDGNIFEAGKAGRIPLGIIEKTNYIEENIFLTITGIFGIPLVGQGSGANESKNGTTWYGAHSIHPNEIRGNAKRNTKRKETMLFRSSFRMILV